MSRDKYGRFTSTRRNKFHQYCPGCGESRIWFLNPGTVVPPHYPTERSKKPCSGTGKPWAKDK